MSDYVWLKDELYHHGILGQKWGKLNGPPYPLGSGDHSKSEQKAGWRKSLGGGRNEELYDRKKVNKQIREHDKKIDPKFKASKSDLDFVINKQKMIYGLEYAKEKAHEIVKSDTFKTAVKIGAVIATTYALKRISQRVLLDTVYDLPNTGDELIKWDARENGFAALSDIPKASVDYYSDYFKEGDVGQLLSQNNFYDNGELVDVMKNPFKLIKKITEDPERFNTNTLMNRSNNCMLCTNNLIMRLKGYETMAQETTNSTGWGPGMISEWFEGAKVVSPHKYTRNGLIKELASQGEGSYGNFICYWKNGGGHSILYTVREDGVHFIDGQIGKEYSYRELFSKLNPENCRYARLDNCEVKKSILRGIESITDDINKTKHY